MRPPLPLLEPDRRSHGGAPPDHHASTTALLLFPRLCFVFSLSLSPSSSLYPALLLRSSNSRSSPPRFQPRRPVVAVVPSIAMAAGLCFPASSESVRSVRIRSTGSSSSWT